MFFNWSIDKSRRLEWAEDHMNDILRIVIHKMSSVTFLLAPQRFTKHSQYSSLGFWPFSSVCIRDPRVPPAPLPSCRPCCVARPAAVSLRWSGKGRRQRGRAAGNTDTLLESAWEAPSVGQHDSHLERDGRNKSVTHRRYDDSDSL